MRHFGHSFLPFKDHRIRKSCIICTMQRHGTLSSLYLGSASASSIHLSVCKPEFSLETQAKIPPALAALFNFVRIHDPSPTGEDGRGQIYPSATNPENTLTRNPDHLGGFISAEETKRADSCRDVITEAMWVQYQEELRRRGME